MLTFGPDHYVSVLKVKESEKLAMRRLAPSIATMVTPLLEIVERKPKPAKKKGDPDVLPTVEQHLTSAFKGLAASVAPFGRFFLDCREIAQDGPAAAEDAFARAAAIGVPFTPVTSVDRSADVAGAMSHRTNGVALRLSKTEFESGVIPSALPQFLATHKLHPGEVDLIIDLGAVDQMVPSGVKTLANAFLADVPNHGAWRTLTLSACGFPSSMGVVSRNSTASVERLEWNFWKSSLYANRTKLIRLPTFSDCGIQHRDGVEGYNPKIMQSSAAIRFADESAWLLLKGESIQQQGGDQFQALAQAVLDEPALTIDNAHCAGCDGVHQAASNPVGFRTLKKWRELGTIHHITLTVESLAALQFP